MNGWCLTLSVFCLFHEALPWQTLFSLEVSCGISFLSKGIVFWSFKLKKKIQLKYVFICLGWSVFNLSNGNDGLAINYLKRGRGKYGFDLHILCKDEQLCLLHRLLETSPRFHILEWLFGWAITHVSVLLRWPLTNHLWPILEVKLHKTIFKLRQDPAIFSPKSLCYSCENLPFPSKHLLFCVWTWVEKLGMWKLVASDRFLGSVMSHTMVVQRVTVSEECATVFAGYSWAKPNTVSSL